VLPVKVWRNGESEDAPPFLELRAGPLDVIFENGGLRFIRLGDHEVINRIYVAARDKNWDTVPSVLSNLKQEVGEDSFRVSYDVECKLREIDFAWIGSIIGDSTGTITFSMNGSARSTFLKNRIGFCVLHSDACAGTICRLLHTDGTTEESSFPNRISPHQPFLDLQGISHEVSPGVWAALTFEGDVFETEDQRNWTDASFKTYCTPLKLPFPVPVVAGSDIRQSVTLRLLCATDERQRYELFSPREATLRVSYAFEANVARQSFPRIGLCAASHGQPLSDREKAILRVLSLDHIRVDLDLRDPNCSQILHRSLVETSDLGGRLHVAIFLSDPVKLSIARLCKLVEDHPCEVALWLVFKSEEACTSDKWVAMTRAALGSAQRNARFASGTNAHFAELNRGPRPGKAVDCLTYSISPQVHSFDDTSIMETLRGQSATVESARLLADGRPIVVSPLTLRPRLNSAATGPLPQTRPEDLPPQVDRRQMSLFGAAWTLGSLSSLAHVGAASLTWYETTGWKGVMETESGSLLPKEFPSLAACVFPMYHVFADVGEMAGGTLLRGYCQPSNVVATLTLEENGKRRSLVANLRAGKVSLNISGFGKRARVRSLDETNVESACRFPELYRSQPGLLVEIPDGAIEIDLLPYAVARIDWEG
jgi:hypothetical protein